MPSVVWLTFTAIMKESAASTCRVCYSEDTDSRVLQNSSKFLIRLHMATTQKTVIFI
jgi:hypothetical protein